MSGLTVPEVPTLTRAEVGAAATKGDVGDGRDFVPRTLRVTLAVTAIGAALLGGLGHYGLVLPFIGGSALGAVLLAGFEYVVRRAFDPAVVLAQKQVAAPGTQSGPKKFGGKAAILLFALIKYPAVAFVLWWVVHSLRPAQVVTFMSGFVLLQLIIGLRGLGAFLVPRAGRK